MDASSEPRSRAGMLLHGMPGHPLHPPLTDVTIGMFVFAAGLALLGALGVSEDATGKACWLALVGGLAVALPTAATGFADWIKLDWGSARWRTATQHLTAMLSAVALFAVAAWLQHPGWERGEVTTGGLVFTIGGAAVLTLGGWLGGSIVFVHGVRVLAAQDRTESSKANPGR